MNNIFYIIEFFFTVVIGLYFLTALKGQQSNKIVVEKESRKEIEKLRRMREVSLTVPLSEKTRPSTFEEIIGQENGIKALRAALCSPNPQHVIIYGPPGVGKTAAARLVLEEAKRFPFSPFKSASGFVEIDATTVRFDDRGIADPLIGSVHDPIYQGAGPMGVAGIPQPKPGAVTRANGGILFIDEIGELHPIEMNKLLKVMEDRKVFLDSVYYNTDDPNMPTHIKDIFDNGLPADFRLVGATTKSPEDLPPAIRSRCIEIYFRALTPDEIQVIAGNAVKKSGFEVDDGCIETIARYATNGREAVNMVQIAGGVALNERRRRISNADIEWVIDSGQYSPRPERKIEREPQVGYANGLAVYGPNMGMLIEIESTAIRVSDKKGKITITGIVDEEETETYSKRFRRKSTARGSVENVLTAIRKYLGRDPRDFDIHLNFPGGVPVDGPSAGISIMVAIYSAIANLPVDNKVAMTGEVSIRGRVKPVGGVNAKIDAAMKAGASRVLIPKDNYSESFKSLKISVIPVEYISEVIENALMRGPSSAEEIKRHMPDVDMLTASQLSIKN